MLSHFLDVHDPLYCVFVPFKIKSGPYNERKRLPLALQELKGPLRYDWCLLIPHDKKWTQVLNVDEECLFCLEFKGFASFQHVFGLESMSRWSSGGNKAQVP